MARPCLARPAQSAPLPVQPLATGDDWMAPLPPLTTPEGTPLRARSASAAVDLCRAAGFRVVCVGGLVDIANPDAPRWIVTVHPEA